MTDPADQDKKDLEELGIETGAFEALERDFQNVLQELVGDKSLARFRVEYEKLHRALQKSYASEKRLIQKCRALNAEIVTNSAKVQSALKMSQDDQVTIAQLKKEIEKAWKMVDVAHEKEMKAKETINQLREAIDKLKKLVEQGAGFSIGQENSVNELFRVKEELQKEVDNHVLTINQLRTEMAAERERANKLAAEKQAAETQIHVLQDAIRTRVVEYDRELQEKQKLDQDLGDVRRELQKAHDDQKSCEDAIANYREQLERLRNDHLVQSDQLRLAREELQRKQDEVTSKVAELQAAKDRIGTVERNFSDANNALVVHQQEIERKKKEIQKELKKQGTLNDKMVEIMQRKDEVDRERMELKKHVQELQHRIESEERARKQSDMLIKNYLTDMDRLRKVQENEMSKVNQQQEVVRKLKNDKDNLEAAINTYKSAAQEHRKQIHELGKKKDKFRTLTMELSTKLLQTQEEVKIKDLIIFDKKKKLHESKMKLKQQRMLYENVRSDRNLYSKQLIEAQDEIMEYKRKFDILNHQIDQLKEEIVVKEQAIFTEHMTHMRVQKDFAAKQIQLSVLGNQIYEARKYQQSQEEEITKLKHIINEADTERMRQKKALEAARNERDILGTQLIRRNDELALLYEKINIQKYTLEKGEKQYAERVKEIRALKNRNKESQRELKVLKAKAEHVENLKMAVYQLQRELLQERNRVKALSEELENPMNIHRWRKLEGTDPDKFDLIMKIQTLQKRLITKTEEVVEKELLIRQKEKYYVELKNILARQPGPEVAEQLNVYQQNLKEKTNALKAMASELHMYQAQVNEYKYENERLNRDLQELKTKFYAQKKKEYKASLKAIGGDTTKKVVPMLDPTVQRFAGGGFAIS